jgi:hypothetical protein
VEIDVVNKTKDEEKDFVHRRNVVEAYKAQLLGLDRPLFCLPWNLQTFSITV